MADIFISYAREDRQVAEALAHALEQQGGYSVFWDRELLPGDAFAEVIGKELADAGRVVVLWSRASATSRWVRDEAQVGLERDVLAPVLIEAVEPPLGFRSIHAADLTGWTLRADDARFRQLLEALKGGAAVMRERARPRRRWILPAAAAGTALAAVIGFFLLGGPAIFVTRHPSRPHTDDMPPDVRAFSAFRDCAHCPEMIAIPPGDFLMGSTRFEAAAQSDERPAKQIDIARPYALGAREVTFDEWLACVDDGGCNGYRPDDEGWGRGQHPVIFVSWDQAQMYVRWLSEKTGKSYRLPSEAEWEYACRAGTVTAYPLGETINAEQASFGRNTGGTRQAGSYPANPWGLFDMNGNVWEWVEDVWQEGHGGRPADGTPLTEGVDPDDRTARGGSWDDPAKRVRCAARNRKDRDQRENEIGFRVARGL